VLIIGSTSDSPHSGSKSDPFHATEIRNELASILSGAELGTVNVTLLDRANDGGSTTYSLAEWFHHPYPAGVETTTRWPNLRGETTPWDYVILIGDPYTMEYMPGLYAQGVAAIAGEVAKGTAETVLLMPWPTGAGSSIDHYKEVVYRTGRSGGLKVAPAGLAWNNDTASPKPLPSDKLGAYICAASIYSTIWGQSAKQSTYVYNAALADSVHTTVTTANAAPQYTGNFSFQNPFLILGDKRRDVLHSEKGTSTEAAFVGGAQSAMAGARVTYDSASYRDKYNSDTPADDGLGWPTGNPMPIAWNQGRKFSEAAKEYVVNSNYWQLGMGFRYQSNTWNYPVDIANDIHIGELYGSDLDLANYMITQNNSARCIPRRLLWALMHQQYPTLNPLSDGTGPHLNSDVVSAVGAYMYTLYSGRCSLAPQPATMTTSWYAQKVGYETAWRLGTCNTRAPGFKVMPSAATAKAVTPSTTETMSVQFIFPPKSDVTVNISISNSNAASLSTTSMTFTPANYNVAPSVVVTGLNGALATEDFNVVFSTTSTDEAYNNLSDSWKYTINRPIPYTCTFNANGGTTPNPTAKTVTYSSTYGTLATTTRAGYIFNGWFTAASGGTLVTSTTSVTATADHTLYAQWSALYTVSYNGNGNTTGTAPSSQIKTQGIALTLATNSGNLTKTGFYFAGWNTAADGSGTNYAEGASYTADTEVILYARWNTFPTISVAATDTVCAEATTADVGVFTLSRAGSIITETLTVNYTLSGSALNGTDYTSLTGSVTFAANSSTATVTITPTNDTAYEGPEDVTLSIIPNAAYLVGSPASATLTIADNDKPTVSVVSSISSTVEGGVVPVLTFSRTGATGVGPLTLLYATSSTAVNGGDYQVLSGSIAIPQNQASISLPITVLQDNVSEVPETLTLTISANTAYTVAGAPANAVTITIVDDNEATAVNISATDNTAAEPAKAEGVGTFTITRSGGTSATVTVNYAASGTAVQGSDFASLSGSVTIPSGQTSATVTITPLDDAEVEPDETVILTLQAGSGYTVGTTSAATGYIYDDEPTQVRVEVGDAKCLEATTADNGTFIMRRLGNRSAALTMNVTISGTATPGSDYTALSETFSINVNTATATATVVPIDDVLVEGAETVVLTLAAGTGYTVNTQNTGTLEIRDDEMIDVTVSVTDTICAEQATADTGTFRITRTNAAATPLTVAYTLSGTAISGSDYTTLSGTATIPANATTVDVLVTPTNDGILEGSESVIMTLTGAGATYDIGDTRSQTLWIKDDETPSITLAATDASAAEADGGVTNQGLWTFTASFAPASNLIINYTVGTNNGIDCVFLPGSITLPAGQTSVTLPLIPIDDELAEIAENVGVTLAYGGNYNLTTTSAVNVSIAASDTPIATVSAFDANAIENPVKTGRILVSLSKIVASNTTVSYTVSGTATSDADYTALSGSVTVGTGNNTAVITVAPLDDALSEGPESVIITLKSSASYIIGAAPSATVIIADDEVVTPLMTWKQSNYGTDWTDQTLAGDAADADGDGLRNLLEYAFGTNPTVHDSRTLATDGSVNGLPVPVDAGGGVFEYYFVRRKDHGTPGSVSCTVHFSSDLTSFTDNVVTPAFVANSSVDPTNYEVVKVTFPGGFRFGRLQIEAVP
jgi:uncharacterized repeat protein (TIGR02543 family)